jgi:class 3 adenylate cyclase
MLGAVGTCVERSPRLAAAAEPGAVAIDGETFAALDDLRARFAPGPDVDDAGASVATYRLVTR